MSPIIMALRAFLLSAMMVVMMMMGRDGLTIHSNPRDFYHDLTVEDQKKLLLGANLQDPNQLNALCSLLSNETFNIAAVYNDACKRISEDRAGEILGLIKGRKDLEALLLGPSCLSPAIIRARKNFDMWPLTEFPLLVAGFNPKGIPIDDLKEMLEQVVNKPEWWYSLDWVSQVEWTKMGGMHSFKLWRMWPVGMYPLSWNIHSSIIKDHLKHQDGQATPQNLEELLMKSIRISDLDDSRIQASRDKQFDVNILWSKFSHLQDSWSTRVLGVLERMYAKNWGKIYFPKILLDSGLLQLASWKDVPIDMATATNDILELFIVACDKTGNSEQKEMFQKCLKSFLDKDVNWLIVRPPVLEACMLKISESFGIVLFEEHLDRILSNTNFFSILPRRLLDRSTSLQAHKYKFKEHSKSLLNKFIEQNPQSPNLDPYTKLLYQEWMKDKVSWPGMMVLHRRISESVREVFRRNKDGTCDPKTDRKYPEWSLAFASIKFDVYHGIPSGAVPSICFLRVLLHYQKSIHINSAELDKIGGDCTFPEEGAERTHYMDALWEAKVQFFPNTSPSLPTANAELLQTVIRGDENNGKDMPTTD